MSKPRRSPPRPRANGRPITRKPRPDELIMVSLKLSGDLVRRVDAVADTWMKERPGSAATRSEVLRVALTGWLDEHHPSTRKA